MVTIPQSGLLAQVSSLRLPTGHSGPVLTLSNAAAPPCPAPSCKWWVQVSALLLYWGSYRWAHNLWVLIIYLFFLSVMLPSVVPSLATDLAVSVSWCLETSLFLRLPSWDGAYPYLFCLSFFFFCLLYFFLPPFEDLGCFSGCLMSSAGIQKLFWGIYSAFKCSFDEFMGEKVVSQSYSSTILRTTSEI